MCAIGPASARNDVRDWSDTGGSQPARCACNSTRTRIVAQTCKSAYARQFHVRRGLARRLAAHTASARSPLRAALGIRSDGRCRADRSRHSHRRVASCARPNRHKHRASNPTRHAGVLVSIKRQCALGTSAKMRTHRAEARCHLSAPGLAWAFANGDSPWPSSN